MPLLFIINPQNSRLKLKTQNSKLKTGVRSRPVKGRIIVSTCETFYFDSANGESKVYTRRWLPHVRPRALLLISHGISEHSGLYEEFAYYLAARGIAVVAHDHIGHGQSVAEGQRYGFFAARDGWAAAVADMEYLRAMHSAIWPGIPCFMFGHSMGSFLLRSYLIEYAPTELWGAIFSGSGQMPPLILKLGALITWLEKKRLGHMGVSPVLFLLLQGGYNRRFRPNRTPVDWLSRDKAMVDAYYADSFCHKLPTLSLYGEINAALAAGARIENLQRLDAALPLFFFSGDQDPVGRRGQAFRRFYKAFAAAGCADMQIKLYQGGRHAMLYEINRTEVYADIEEWLYKKLSEKAISGDCEKQRPVI